MPRRCRAWSVVHRVPKGFSLWQNTLKRKNTTVKNETSSSTTTYRHLPVHRCPKADTTTVSHYCGILLLYRRSSLSTVLQWLPRGQPSSPPLLSASALIYCRLGTFLHPYCSRETQPRAWGDAPRQRARQRRSGGGGGGGGGACPLPFAAAVRSFASERCLVRAAAEAIRA